MRCSCSGFVIGRVCCMLRLSPAQHLSVARSSSRENYLPGWKALNRKTTSTHQLSFDSFLLVYFYFIFFFFFCIDWQRAAWWSCLDTIAPLISCCCCVLRKCFLWVEKQEKTNPLKRENEEETGNFSSYSQGNGKHIKRRELRRAN